MSTETNFAINKLNVYTEQKKGNDEWFRYSVKTNDTEKKRFIDFKMQKRMEMPFILES